MAILAESFKENPLAPEDTAGNAREENPLFSARDSTFQYVSPSVSAARSSPRLGPRQWIMFGLGSPNPVVTAAAATPSGAFAEQACANAFASAFATKAAPTPPSKPNDADVGFTTASTPRLSARLPMTTSTRAHPSLLVATGIISAPITGCTASRDRAPYPEILPRAAQ